MREVDGRLQQFFPWHRAKTLMCKLQAGYRAGYANCEDAVVIRVVKHIAVFV